MASRWICNVYENFCALEEHLSYEPVKGSEDTDESSMVEKEMRNGSSGEITESYVSVKPSSSRRRSRHDEKKDKQRRKARRSSSLHRNKMTPRTKGERSKDKNRSSQDDAVPEVIITSSSSAEKKSAITYTSSEYHDGLIPIGSMVPIAIDQKDSASISTSDSFSSLKRKWRLGLKPKREVKPMRTILTLSKENPLGGNNPTNEHRKEPDVLPTTTPHDYIISHDGLNPSHGDLCNYQSQGNDQTPIRRQRNYTSDTSGSGSGFAGGVPRSQRNNQTHLGRQNGYSSDIQNTVPSKFINTDHANQVRRINNTPSLRQRSSSGNSTHYLSSRSSDIGRTQRNIQVINSNGTPQSFSANVTNYTASGSSDADHPYHDHLAWPSTNLKNNSSRLKPKFGFMRKRKEKGIKRIQQNEPSAKMNISPHSTSQLMVRAGSTNHPYPSVVEMVPSSYNQGQSIPPPVSKVYVKGISPLSQHSIQSGELVTRSFYSARSHPGHPTPRSFKDDKYEYGYI